MPEYSIPIECDFWGVSVTLSVDWYEPITQWGQNQKDARKDCAIEFAKQYLSIDVEAEQAKVTWENSDAQQIRYQTENLPNSFKVDADVCGNWDGDAVSALQVFCQKNKFWFPKYIRKCTSHWYVTETTMRMNFWDFSTLQSAPTKQEAKQKCARAFYTYLKSGSLAENKNVQNEDDKPNPALFEWWKAHPRFTLQKYCSRYKIDLHIEYEDDSDDIMMTVWDEIFYTSDIEYLRHGGFRRKSIFEAQEELAKFYYQKKIEPILRKQKEAMIYNASESILDDLILPNMSSNLDEKGSDDWNKILNALFVRAKIPTPLYYAYEIPRNWDGKEIKSYLPKKNRELRSINTWKKSVIYMKIAWIKKKFRWEWESFWDAQNEAAWKFFVMMRKKKYGEGWSD